MNRIVDLPDASLHALRQTVRADYDAFRARGLKLDMTRGKPAPEQLDLANAMLAFPGNRDFVTESGEDARNYGVLQGLPEVRTLFAPMLGAPANQVVVADNSSLAVMHDCIVWAAARSRVLSVVYSSTVLRPLSLARYIATSACSSSKVASLPS